MHKLLTKELEKRFAEVGNQDGLGGMALVIAKYFNPRGGGTWYATEYDPETRCFFGLVVWHETELGDFSLDEFEATRCRPLGIERDLHFKERALKDVPGCPDWLKTGD
jgi:hypothetical protein